MEGLDDIRGLVDRELVGLSAGEQSRLLVGVVEHCRTRLLGLPNRERPAVDVLIVRRGRAGWLLGRLILNWWRLEEWLRARRTRKKGG